MQNDNQEKKTEELRIKIQEQNQTIQRLKSEQNKISQYVSEFRNALKRKRQKEEHDVIKKQSEAQQKLQSQLSKQIQTAKTILKNYQHDLKDIQKKSQKTSTQDDLLKIQQQTQTKMKQLKQTQQEIKDLKLIKKKLQKIIENRQKSEVNEVNKFSKLSEQLKRQKQMLESLKSKNAKKQQLINKKKSQILTLQTQYNNNCKKTGQKPLIFEDYKEKRKQKRKEQISTSKNKDKQLGQKKIITVKDMINNQYQSYSMEPNQRNLQELKIKKEIAQNSLKLANKKNQKQIQEAKMRLQRLKDQSEMLSMRIQDKNKEKQLILLSKKSGQTISQTSQYSQFRKNKITSKNGSLIKSRASGSQGTFKLQPLSK